MRIGYLLVICMLFVGSCALAQNSIKGTVLDSLTREPVSFANVYFANTTFGTTTDENGKFSLSGFANGKYDLTISFVGYFTQQISLDFQNTAHTANILLPENSTQLAEVIVSPDTTNRYFDLQEFKKNFLGQSNNTRRTKIKNEDDLDFTFEPQTRFFTAFSRKPLEVVNDALGYKVVYDLYAFEIDYAKGSQLFYGIPRFENLSAKLKPRWQRERKRAYNGSFMHFIHSLRAGSFGDDFDVFEFFRNPNPDRPSEEFLQQKITYWRDNQLPGSGKITIGPDAGSDSLSYYISLRRLPELIDSVGRKITDPFTLLNTDRTKITLTGMLYVIYKKEPEEDNYSLHTKRPAQPRQSSVIHIIAPLTIYDNGYYEAVQSVFFEGYMGWGEKISELLPLGYKPED